MQGNVISLEWQNLPELSGGLGGKIVHSSLKLWRGDNRPQKSLPPHPPHSAGSSDNELRPGGPQCRNTQACSTTRREAWGALCCHILV